MTETGTSVQEAPQNVELEQQQEANRLVLDQMMQLNLNGVLPEEKKEEAAVIIPATEAQVIPVTFESLKEKFGYDTPEAAIKDIEELRVFKSKPPVAEIKYENETSERIAKALQAGKTKEVYEALRQQETLNSLTTVEVNEENAADIIKLGMQLKYKDLSPKEIDYKFNKQYAIPREPVMGDSELEEDFNERKAAWKEQVEDIKMSKIIDAKLARPDLETAKSKIVFPEIENQVDNGYAQYLKELEQQPILDAQIKEAYGKFTPKTLETKVKFIDEPNKIDFEFQHEPDAEAFKKTIDVVSDFDKLIEAFKKPDGTPDREAFARAMYVALNTDKVIMEAIKQSKNATIKSFLPDNSGGGTQRQFPQTQELSELDKQMQAAGIKRA